MNLDQFVVGVVDDDPHVLESIEELLASAGYTVLPFLSPESFLDAKGFQRVDCLISDISMPVMSGWDLLEAAQAQPSPIPVILITARDEEIVGKTKAAKGARYLFRKPFDGRELLAALESVLTSKP